MKEEFAGINLHGHAARFPGVEGDPLEAFQFQGRSGHVEFPETEYAGVAWILAENWWPYQRPTFVTPPFAGYVSGHSTYSRAAAEVMTLLTGSEFFPAGLGEFFALATLWLSIAGAGLLPILLVVNDPDAIFHTRRRGVRSRHNRRRKNAFRSQRTP